MSIETLNSLKQRVGELSTREKLVLANYLLEQVETGRGRKPNHATEAVRRKRQEWVRANRARFGGLYVALDAERLIATGTTYV